MNRETFEMISRTMGSVLKFTVVCVGKAAGFIADRCDKLIDQFSDGRPPGNAQEAR